jgi:hypothetical protein
MQRRSVPGLQSMAGGERSEEREWNVQVLGFLAFLDEVESLLASGGDVFLLPIGCNEEVSAHTRTGWMGKAGRAYSAARFCRSSIPMRPRPTNV